MEAEQAHAVPAASSVESLLAMDEFGEPIVAELRALDANTGAELARDCAWTEPFKFYRLDGLDGTALNIRREGASLLLSCTRPVKGLWLQSNAAGWTDNFIDLVPGAPRRVEPTGSWPTLLELQALDLPVRAVDTTD
jgi:beta-mannosidase